MIIIFPNPETALSHTPFFVDEENIGCWVQSNNSSLSALGDQRVSHRFALHIPSQTQKHLPLLTYQIEAFAAAARDLGLNQVSKAVGYWTLDSGVVQQEPLLIAWSNEPVDEQALREIASRILLDADQEAVAIEVTGTVEIVRD